MCYIRVSLDQGADIQVQHVLIAGKDFREKRQSVKGRVKVRHVPGDLVEESLQLRSLTLYLLWRLPSIDETFLQKILVVYKLVNTMGIWNPDWSRFWRLKRDWVCKWCGIWMDLKSELFWILNGQDFEWDLKSGSPTVWNKDQLPPFCQKPFEIRTKMSKFWMAWFWNGYDYSYSHS